MALSPGTKLGPYEILARIGAGGMGEVFRARDTRLNRDVALKVLLDIFAKDAERMARFEREAQVLASLNHPNIATLHGLEESGLTRALVMELVEGPTLAERIRAGPIPAEEALPIARQIAEALEYAHEKAVIHRDLKPANVKITPEGTVKVLDFGLAKALEDTPAAASRPDSPTLSLAATRAGVILGTAAYMSPEQAKGKPADRRSDVWAFGAVLFEMLAGRPAYSGETTAETLASVMKDQPRWEALPAEVPGPIRKLLRRCLERDARRRLQAIGEARLLLEDMLAGKPDEEAHAVVGPRGQTPSRRQALLLGGAAMVLVAALAAFAAWTWKPSAHEARLRKLELAPGKVQPAFGSPISISPDGRKIAYVSGNRLWIRDFDQFEPRQISNSEGAIRPFWSPDSAFVGYGAGERIWKAPAGGGQGLAVGVAPRGITDAGGAAWQRNGRIVFTTGSSGLLEVSAQGGDSRPLLEPSPEAELDFHHPSSLPEGRGVLFAVHRKAGIDTLAVFSERGRKDVFQLPGQRLTNPVYSPTGHILFYRALTNLGIWALPFSLSKLEAAGEPFLAFPNGNDPSASSDGTLAFVRGAETVLTQLARANRSGQVEGAIGQPQGHGSYYGFFPALSPDGRRLAVVAGDISGNEVWIHDFARDARTRLTSTSTPKHMLAWSPAGDQLAFVAGGNTLEYTVWLRAADGTGEPQKLVQGGTPEFSPDGKFLVYAVFKRPDDWNLWYVPLQGDRKPVAIVQGSGWRMWPRVSPDGRYLAYLSDESGRLEVFLTRFPSGDGKWQVSVNGGYWPRWNRSGNRLFFTDQDQSILEVEVRTSPTPSLGKPVKLFARKPAAMPWAYGWPDGFDVSADGKRFFFLQPVGTETSATGITIVENWFAEFRNRK